MTTLRDDFKGMPPEKMRKELMAELTRTGDNCRIARVRALVDSLVEVGADLNAPDEAGRTPQALAGTNEHRAAVKLIASKIKKQKITR